MDNSNADNYYSNPPPYSYPYHYDVQQPNNYINPPHMPSEPYMYSPNVAAHYVYVSPDSTNIPTQYMQNYPTNNIPECSSIAYQTPQHPERHASYQQNDPRFKVNKQESTTDILDGKNDDELWIEAFLSKTGKISLSLQSEIEILVDKPKRRRRRTNELHLRNVKAILLKSTNILRKLRFIENYLSENVEKITSTEWKEKTVEIGQKRDEFTSLMTSFDSPDTIKNVKKTLIRRKKQRIHRKYVQKIKKIKETENLSYRQMLHDNIDSWIEKMNTDTELSRREEALKKDTDCILFEVTKKKTDSKRQLSILSSLIKLRSIREKKRPEQTVTSEQESNFKINIDELQKMWESSLTNATDEDKTLRSKIEKSAAQELVDEIAMRNKEIEEEWRKVLFGANDFSPNELYHTLTAAEKDLGIFIATRKSWDTFAVPKDSIEGSKLPIGWVLPKTNNATWSQYLETKL